MIHLKWIISSACLACLNESPNTVNSWTGSRPYWRENHSGRFSLFLIVKRKLRALLPTGDQHPVRSDSCRLSYVTGSDMCCVFCQPNSHLVLDWEKNNKKHNNDDNEATPQLNWAQQDCADLIPRKIIGSVCLELTSCSRRHSCHCLPLLLLRGGHKNTKTKPKQREAQKHSWNASVLRRRSGVKGRCLHTMCNY